MIRIFTRRGADISYLLNDRANELEGPRDGPALWHPLAELAASPDRVLRAGGRSAILGYDLVVAAPRPASTLLAVGGADEAAGAVAAHRLGVTDALTYLADRAVTTRRVVLGDAYTQSARWSAVASFTHGVNRAGEPHLHDHVLVSGADDRGRRIDGGALFSHVAAADAIYRARLRTELTAHTGRASWRSFRGGEYVDGLDEGVRALWPGRALDRPPKRNWTRPEIQSRWAADLAHYETGPTVSQPRRGRDVIDEHAFRAHFEGRERVGRADLVEAWSNAATFGTTRSATESAIDAWYPGLSRERGRGTVELSRVDARQVALVNDRGPRELAPEPADQRRTLSRSRDRAIGTWER